MKRRFNFLKALLPLILAAGTFSGCNQDSPESPKNIKVSVKNWPENVTEIYFGGESFTEDEIKQQKEGSFWAGENCGLNVWFNSDEDILYGTIKDKTNFKVLVNGKEIPNESLYYEYESAKTNLSTLFYANIKAEAEMELSFEGSPEEINPKDVKLLDETGYSYIYIEDSLAETMDFSFSYEEEDSNINQLCSGHLNGKKTLVYPVKTDKKITMYAYPKDGYVMKNPFNFSTNDEATIINPSENSEEYFYFRSNPFSPLQANGAMLTITGTLATELSEMKISMQNWPENVEEISIGYEYDSIFYSQILFNKDNFGEQTTSIVPGKKLDIQMIYKYESGKEYGTIDGEDDFNVFINNTKIQNTENHQTFYLDEKEVKTNVLKSFKGTFSPSENITISFEGSPKEINPKDVRLLNETGYSYLAIDDSLFDTMFISFEYANDSSYTNINNLVSGYHSLYPVRKNTKIIMKASPLDGYGMNENFYFTANSSEIPCDTVNSYYPTFTSEEFSTSDTDGSILSITGTPATKLKDINVSIATWPKNVEEISIGYEYDSIFYSQILFNKDNFGKQTIKVLPEKDINIQITYTYNSDIPYGTIDGEDDFNVFINSNKLQNNAEHEKWRINEKEYDMNTQLSFSSSIAQTDSLNFSFEGYPKKIDSTKLRLLNASDYSYLYIDDSLFNNMNINFDYANTGSISDINELICKIYDNETENSIYLVRTNANIKMTASPKINYEMKSSFNFTANGNKIESNTENSSEQYFSSQNFKSLSTAGEILTISGTPAEEIPDIFAEASYYANRIIKIDISSPSPVVSDIKNAKISFGTNKTVELIVDNTTLSGTYGMTTSSEATLNLNDYNGYLNSSEGYFSISKLNTTYTFYLSSEDKIKEPTIGFYADGEAVAKKGEKVPLNVKFVYFDSVPDEVTVYLKGDETDTNLGTFTLNGKNSGWDQEVTDATIELDTSAYPAGEYLLYVKAGEVESNELSVTLTE